ncbi:MAG: NADP-dependent phosphogluconate dehydrogenase [Deltaproteobacteria bacterium]|nr:NADP-dependent phosphogluconate dehydrogenase [Deltaproteobacteria bacterium]
MPNEKCEIGVFGLGTMGLNLALNFADHGFPVAVYNRTTEKTREFMAENAGSRDLRPGYDLNEFIGLLRQPRAIIIMVSSGKAVDAVIDEILPYLQPGDVLIDGGNSHFTDTDRRLKSLADKQILFLGLGVSGGEAGARYGPSLMPGGPREAYGRVKSVLQKAAAQVNGEPCVTYLGPGSAGHYVKMVHNGIEYGLMELIAETYDLLKRALGLPLRDIADLFEQWDREELNSFLINITPKILRHQDPETGTPLIDMILDVAQQKGTGMWTTEEALQLQVGTLTIDTAVMMRDLSNYKSERQTAARVLGRSPIAFKGDRQILIKKLKNALFAGMITTYAQGMALLKKASENYDYGLNLEAVARIWRGGCIIRSALLEHIRSAFVAKKDLPNLLLDPYLGQEFISREDDLRDVVIAAAEMGLPAAAMMATLAYEIAYSSAQLPANLIQAQRDYFGAHTYKRIDVPGSFHTEWDQD